MTKEGSKDCLITVEEAQRVLGEGSNTRRFETIAREGRKFGVGLCAITQQPKLIDKQLLSQFNTLVVMGLGDRNDRSSWRVGQAGSILPGHRDTDPGDGRGRHKHLEYTFSRAGQDSPL